MGRSILVTGGSGYFGEVLAELAPSPTVTGSGSST